MSALRTRLPILAAVILGGITLPRATAGSDWKVYENCRLIEHDANDGDSFHVHTGWRHYIFRLYFVDAPETEDTYPERVAEQAAYFGIDAKAALKVGRDAATFTRRFLKKPFTVYTKRIDARGQSDRPRFFAMVETRKGFLSKALVEQGLARIYGAKEDLPDGKSERFYAAELRVAERAAKRADRGAWSLQPSLRDLRTRSSRPGQDD